MIAKCIKFYEFGDPKNVLKIEDMKIEPPKEKEVLVRMIARPINPSDLIPIRGAYSHRIALPNNYEGVGIVEAVGSRVSKDLIGKRVLPLRGEGTWQEYVKTAEPFVVPMPDFIDNRTAAQMYINPLTAWVTCTEVLKLKPNDVLVVNAAGSSIGRIFAQLARILGFTLIAITRNDTDTNNLLNLGASFVINTSSGSLYEAVMDVTSGLGADVAIDSIGGIDGTQLAYCVHPNGNFLSIGLLSGKQVNWAEIVKQAKVNANIFHLRNWNYQVSIEKWHKVFQQIINLLNDNKLYLTNIHSEFDLLEIKKAIKVIESEEKSRGKILLTSY